jgi:hypothetical protein
MSMNSKKKRQIKCGGCGQYTTMFLVSEDDEKEDYYDNS